MLHEDGCLRLVKAVICRAAKDYIDALRQRDESVENVSDAPTPSQTIRECERFFESDWCDELCLYAGIGHDGHEVMEAAQRHAMKRMGRA